MEIKEKIILYFVVEVFYVLFLSCKMCNFWSA